MITAEQRALRRQSIGASDAPAIVGVDPWRTAGDVYWSKVGDLEDRHSAAMQVGNRMEKPLLDFAEERLHITLQRDVYQLYAGAPLHANLDGLFPDGVVEAKYVGPKSADYWGEDGTDQVPDHVFVQVQQQMLIARRPLAYIPAAVVDSWEGLSFRMYEVPFDEDVAGNLLSILSGWWAAYVATRTPPPDSIPSLETLKRIIRQPAKIAELSDSQSLALTAAWERRQELAAEIKALDERRDAETAAILAALGDADAGRLPDGRLFSYAAENGGKRFDFDNFYAFAGVSADDAKAFWAPYTRRVLRLKKGKK